MNELTTDYALLRDWRKAHEEAPQPFEFPYVARFQRGDTQLHYVAACHGGDIDSATMKTVRAEFDIFRPDIVIVEGAHSDEISPAWYLEHCQGQAKGDHQEGGEGSYAVVLAGDRNIPFIPAEPSEWQMFQGFLKHGYTLEDVLGWNASTMIKLRHDAGSIDESTIERLANERIQSDLCLLGQNDETLNNYKFNFHDFRNWYRDRMGKDFTLPGIAADKGSPRTGPDANFLQKIMAAADTIREPHIVDVIARQLADFKKVLVVYGSAHLDKQEQVFRKMLGHPTYAKPFSDDESAISTLAASSASASPAPAP